VCECANKTSNGLFHYGFSITASDRTTGQKIVNKFLFVDKHFWIIDINKRLSIYHVWKVLKTMNSKDLSNDIILVLMVIMLDKSDSFM